MRVSDEERERVIDELRRHCAAGRLDFEEYSFRLERAHAAATLEELDELRADLPMMRIPDPRTKQLARRSGTTQSERPASMRASASAFLVALIAVALVLAVALLSLLLSWSWAAVLLAGWAAGLVQARLRGRRRTSPS